MFPMDSKTFIYISLLLLIYLIYIITIILFLSIITYLLTMKLLSCPSPA